MKHFVLALGLVLASASLSAAQTGFAIDLDKDVIRRLDGTQFLEDLDIGDTGKVSGLWGCTRDGLLTISGTQELEHEDRSWRASDYFVTIAAEQKVTVEIRATEHASPDDILREATSFGSYPCIEPEDGKPDDQDYYQVLSVNGLHGLKDLLRSELFAGHVDF